MARRNPSTDEDEFCSKARERYKRSKEYWDEIYEPQKEEKKFYAGDQWPSHVLARRNADPANPRPAMTINRLPQYHNQIVNDYRQSSLSMKASPQERDDIEVARVYSGLFKQIEKQSVAQVAYTMALSNGAIHGLGYIRALTKFESDISFDQGIYIDRVTNPFSHYPDENATGFFLEDSNYHFIVSTIPKEEYEEEYPGFNPEDFTDDDGMKNWRNSDSVVVAEYFFFKTEEYTLVQYQDGFIGREDEEEEEPLEIDGIEEIGDEATDDEEADDRSAVERHGRIVRKRKVSARVLYWCKIDGYNILEKPRRWATNRIPVVPIWGNELWIEEKRQLTGIVRGAKDSQRMYNYWQSAKTEMIALAPKAPYIAAEGQLEGREEEWRDAAHTPKSVLYYKPVAVDGHLVGAPQRQSYEAPVQGIIQASLQSSDDMKATIGLYDASLGAKGNEVSGRAIMARKSQGATATYNFVDNLALGIGYLGTIIAELIPKIYDTERSIRIIGQDGAPVNVAINGEGQPDIVNIKYDLVLDTGPSYATQREETTAIFMELARQYPKLYDVAGDVIIRSMDVTGAQEISERLKRTLPPEVVGDDADAETKLAAASVALEHMKSALAAATDRIEETEADVQLLNAKLNDKTGELKIRQQEVNIKRDEAKAKLIAAAGAVQDGKDANKLISEVMSALHELGGKFEGMMDMVEALSGPEDDIPDPVVSPENPAAQ